MNRLLVIFLLPISLLGQTPRLQLEVVSTGLYRPTALVAISASEFLVGQTDGLIRLVRNGVVQTDPFLDIGGQIGNSMYEGVFGLAIHPQFSQNGYVYVHYSRINDLSSVIVRYTRNPTNPDQADPFSAKTILIIPYPNGGHRSGHLAFGPDGYLYITTGDSSSGARGPVSPADRLAQQLAQNLQDLHGKVLRIDVDKGSPYAIPPSNPFASPTDGVLDELYAYGLRNPWRWSFDRLTGDCWIADVGQDDWEELNVTVAGTAAPRNYGWPCYEGTMAYVSPCSPTGNDQVPLLTYAGYTLASAASITGGYVYRGTAYPDLWGWYIYADYMRGTYWTLKRNVDGTYQQVQQGIPAGTSPVSFAEGLDGELYVLSFAEGVLYHIRYVPITSVKSGAWTDVSTWNCLCLPTANDPVLVKAGHVVSVTQTVSVKRLQLEGSLTYSSGGGIQLNPD